MIIIIKKDGQIVTDDGNPIEGKALEGAYMLLADAQDGDSIVYDGTNHMWKAGHGGGGSFAPDITDPQDGDTLVYNATQQKWVNGAGAGGGGVMVVHADENDTLDKTWLECKNAIVAGVSVVLVEEFNQGGTLFYQQIPLTIAVQAESVYALTVSDDSLSFDTNSENGYPAKPK